MNISIQVTDEYQIGIVQIRAKKLADKLGFSPADSQRIATAASELVSNLVFHTEEGGLLTMRSLQKGESIGIEIISEDNGPGIRDIELALQDGFSTHSGSLGCGLPAVNRLMHEMEIYSDNGTKVIARRWQSCK